MHPNQPQRPVVPQRSTPAPAVPPRPFQPTAWKSVPTFIRFMIWVGAIIGFIYAIVIPVLLIVLLVGGGLAAAA